MIVIQFLWGGVSTKDKGEHIMCIISLPCTAVLSTFLSDNLITLEEAEGMTLVAYSRHSQSSYFVWSLAKKVCMHQSLDVCQKVAAKLEQFNLHTSDSINILKGVCAR